MKELKSVILSVLLTGMLNSQVVINGDLVINTYFKGSPFLGVSGGYLGRIGYFCYAGGNAGIRFFTELGTETIFHVPIMVEIRLHNRGDDVGFYTFSNLGIVFASYSNNTAGVNVKSSGLFLGFCTGAGYRVGSIDFSLRYEGVLIESDITSLLGLKVGYWFGDDY